MMRRESVNHSATSVAATIPGIVFLAGFCAAANASNPGLEQRPVNLSCVAPDRPVTTLNVGTQQVFPVLPLNDIDPIAMSQPPGDASRWFIAGRDGEIYSFANDDTVSSKQLVLDMTDRMQFTSDNQNVDSQQYGIVGFAIHPQFPASPYVYVGYNAKPGPDDPLNSTVSRFSSLDGGLTLDASTEQVLIAVEQIPGVAHHLDQVMFGMDGYLHIALGDGGSGSKAQDLNDLRGSLLRLDVDGGSPYAIPPDNPFVGTGFREEIYAYGLRNPWRFTVDRDTGEIWLGDVGAVSWEEVNRVESGGNYGWPTMEGAECRAGPGCDMTGLLPPELPITHPDALAIIGGYVYRGSEIPGLQGTYIFGDALFNEVRGLFYDTQGAAYWEVIADAPYQATSYAEGLDGEIYLLRHVSPDIHKLVPAAAPAGAGQFPGLLSETGCFDPADPTIPAGGLIPYTVNAPLWSDGADKDRWMALPDGQTVGISPDGDFQFPNGTVLVKNFAFDNEPIETRLFIRHDDGGWAGYSYEWNEDLTDAVLLEDSKTKEVAPGITWTYPSRDQCMQCHTEVAGYSLGLETLQLNGHFQYPSTGIDANQLATLDHIGIFTGGLPDQPANLQALVSLDADGAPDERKARSYLHSNCSGCHRAQGPAPSTADFRFANAIEAMGICDVMPSGSDLGIPGAKLLSPGDPAGSIISERMHRLDFFRMPPLGSAIVDLDGTAIVDAWIALPDVCAIYADSDFDQVRDNVDNCSAVANADQRDTDGDGIGNLCDPDVAGPNDCMVNFLDLNVYADNFFQTGDLDTDNNGDGITNFLDLNVIETYFFSQPGPSATGCN